MFKFRQAAFFLIIGLTFWGCEKEKLGPYSIQVSVTNKFGIPIQNATLRMYAPIGSDGTVNFYGTTNEDGQFTFEYDYPAYLRIDAVKSSWKGCGFVELNQQNEVGTLIVMKPFNDLDNGCPPL